jgi:hypothetical protein
MRISNKTDGGVNSDVMEGKVVPVSLAASQLTLIYCPM